MMNKAKGNMYPWVTHTWNPIAGRCPHECSYCYMKSLWDRFGPDKLIFREKYMEDNLGKGNTIFVGDSTDMFAGHVPIEWILKTLEHCMKYPENIYVFQTKNPKKLHNFSKWLDKLYCMIGITIETNREYNLSKAPSVKERALYAWYANELVFISIEPVMDFDLEEFAKMIKTIKPKFVSIGADSKNSNLPEPDRLKLQSFIEEIAMANNYAIEVKLKDNLARLLVHPEEKYTTDRRPFETCKNCNGMLYYDIGSEGFFCTKCDYYSGVK